jgi:hypothetical protein
LLVVVLWTTGRPFSHLDDDADRRLAGPTDRHALECGMVLLLMVLLSPMSSKAHFGTLVLPGFCLAQSALRSRSPLLRGTLAAAIVLGLLCNKDPLGEKLYTLSLWYGVVTWQALVLLAGCLIAYRQKQICAQEQLPCPAPGAGSSTQAA